MFGQVVICSGLGCSIILLLFSLSYRINIRFPNDVLCYNVIWFSVYLIAGILALKTWLTEGWDTKIKESKGGVCVGYLCLINCGNLAINS
ncbi:hypothetical protein Anas_02623, partial [Armadillidium nasatum]